MLKNEGDCVGILVLLMLFLLMPFRVFAASAVESVVEQTEKSVVRILSQGEPGNRCTWGTGTGFVINQRGHVVTNAHVITYELRKKIRIRDRVLCIPVDESGRPIVVMDDNHVPKIKNGRFVYIRGHRPIKKKANAVFVLTGKKGFDQKVAARSVVLYDTLRDLAVLKVPDLQRSSIVISTAKSRKGAQVVSLGFPGIADAPARARLNDPSAFDGVISRIFAEEKRHRWVIQHGAQIDKGNSGGPLFNTCNQVVGVNTYFVARRGGPAPVFFYSIYATTLAEQLRKVNVPFKAIDKPCVTSTGSSAEVSKVIFSVSEMNKKTLLWGGTSLGLAVLALLVSLRRPREQIVRVAESASQLLRR
ncbi:MAG: trypsin-like peptidase domain-containing protein [bacterium]